MNSNTLDNSALNDKIVEFFTNYNNHSNKISLGKNRSISGKIQYICDTENYCLITEVIEDKGVKYTEKIYLPIQFDLKNGCKIVEDKIQHIKTNIVNFLYDGSREISLSSIEQLKKLLIIYSVMIELKNIKTLSMFEGKNTLLEQEASIKRQMRDLYSQINTKDSDDLTQFISLQEQLFTTNSDIETVGVLIRNQGIPKTIKYEIPVTELFERLDDDTREYLIKQQIVPFEYDDIINRPRLTTENNSLEKLEKKVGIDVIDNKLNLYTNINYVMDSVVVGKGKINSQLNKIKIPNIDKLTIRNRDYTFTIDDFTFNSVYSYHLASRYYNRMDLDPMTRSYYNDVFIRFTKEYTGLNSLYSKSFDDIEEYLRRSDFKTSSEWLIGTFPPSSIFLRKAIYQRIISNPELKEILLSTDNTMIFEKINRNTYRYFYELMEVREFIKQGIEPPYSNYNYNNSIYTKFIEHKHNKLEDKEILVINVLSNMEAFKNRNSPTIMDEIIENINVKLDGMAFDTSIIERLLFKYQGNIYYNIIYKEYQLTDEELFRKFPQFERFKHFVLFVKKLAMMDKKRELEEKQAEMAQKLKEIEIQKVPKDYDLSYFKQNMFIPKRNTSDKGDMLYNSIIIDLIRQEKYPFNFNIKRDTRTKFPSKFIDLDGKIEYKQAIMKLRGVISNLAEANNIDNYQEIGNYKNPFTETDFELLCRFLNMDIYLYDAVEKEVKNYKYSDIRVKYPQPIQGMIDKIYPTGIIRLGITESVIYVLEPNLNERDRVDEYLYENTTSVMLKANDDESQSYIGKWNLIDRNIDYIDMTDEDREKLQGEIEMEILRFYWIGDMCFYKNTEIWTNFD